MSQFLKMLNLSTLIGDKEEKNIDEILIMKVNAKGEKKEINGENI